MLVFLRVSPIVMNGRQQFIYVFEKEEQQCISKGDWLNLLSLSDFIILLGHLTADAILLLFLSLEV